MAMTTEKKLYTAGGVLVVMLGGLWATQRNVKQDEMAHSAAGTSAKLPDIKLAADDVEKVTKVQIKNANKGEVVLEKDGDAWKVSKPVSAAANQSNVKSLLDNLKDIKLKDSIDPGTSQYATYELEDDKAVRVQVYKGSDKAVDLLFGKSGSRGQMTRIGEKDGVYVAGGYSGYMYTRDVKDWRDRDVLKFEDGNVTSLVIDNTHGRFSFSKNDDKWSGTYKGKAIENFDQEKVKDMLRAYKALSADDFGDDKSAADTGLDKPESTVTITLKDGAGTFKLMIGKTSSGTSRYAKKDGSPTVYTLASYSADWATAEESKFQKTDAKADAGAAKKPDKSAKK
jgi:Domain of unknown function (DUF4340)